jgi:hypothetical protein
VDVAEPELEELAGRLAVAGLTEQAAELLETRKELAYLDRPPGPLAPITRPVRRAAARQWKLATAELRESREAWTLIQRRLQGGEPLSAAEADVVRSQVFDVMKLVPASAIAAATAVVPVPGAMLASPWVLHRLGLMPSRWREAHALERLRAQGGELERLGRPDEALALARIISLIEEEADRREQAAQSGVLLEHWDLNGDGRTDAEERDAYERELARLSEAARTAPERKRWFVQQGGHVAGPLRWTEIDTAELGERLLACLAATGGWVSLADLRARTERDTGEAQPA